MALGNRCRVLVPLVVVTTVVAWVVFGGDDEVPGTSQVPVSFEVPDGTADSALDDLELPEVSRSSAERVVVPSAAAAATELEPVTFGPRDLAMRVVGPDGAPVNGVPLQLEPDEEGGRKSVGRKSMRLSGYTDLGDFDDGVEASPGVEGIATWVESERPLRNLWKLFEAEKVTALILRVGGPDSAHLDRRFEFAAWPTDPVELRLDAAAVARAAPIEVQVFRADGAPAVDVPVFLGFEALDPEFGRAIGLEDYRPDAAKVPHTDAEGRALLPVQSFLQMNMLFGSDEPMFDPYVGIALPMSHPPHEEVQLGAGGLVRVDLPELGRLEARLVDAEGRLLDFTGQESGIRYQVRWSAASGSDGFSQKGKLYAETLQNPIDLGLCGLGVHLDGWAADLSRRYLQGDWEGTGPSQADELVHLDFDMGTPRPQTRFVVLDPGGTPLAETDVSTLIRETRPKHAYNYPAERCWFARHTDGEGAFVVEASKWSRASVLEVEVKGESLWARLELPREATVVWHAAGETLGDRATLVGGTLRLSSVPLPPLPVWEKPILVSGTVLDDAGLPVEEASLYAEKVAGVNRNLGWARTDRDGHFEIVKESEGRFWLRVSADRCANLVTDEYDYGTRDLVLTLERLPEPGSLHGRLVNLPKTNNDQLEVRVDQDGRDYRETPDADGRFEFKELSSGHVMLRIESVVLELELVAFDDVEVGENERRTDPRFEELDVASLVKLRHFTFETSAGEKLGSMRVLIGSANGKSHELRVGPRGTCELFVPTDWTSAWVRVRGYQPAEVSLDDPDVLLRLQPL